MWGLGLDLFQGFLIELELFNPHHDMKQSFDEFVSFEKSLDKNEICISCMERI